MLYARLESKTKESFGKGEEKEGEEAVGGTRNRRRLMRKRIIFYFESVHESTRELREFPK